MISAVFSALSRAKSRVFTREFLKAFSLSLVQLEVVYYCVHEYLVVPQLSTGASMMPTLQSSGDLLIGVRPALYRPPMIPAQLRKMLGLSSADPVKGGPNRATGLAVGDLVSAVHPNDPNKMICKRVVGLPGDTVLFDPRVDPSPSHSLQWSAPAERTRLQAHTTSRTSEMPVYIVVPRGHVWLSGDNLSNSTDSRHYGPLPLALIRAKIVARSNIGVDWYGLHYRGSQWLPNPMRKS